MSDGKRLSFEELTNEKELLKDCTVETVTTERGDVMLASATSEGILAWFEENEHENADVRRYKGLRLVVRCLINDDDSRVISDGSSGSEEVLAAVSALRRRDSNANAKLIETAFKINGLHVLDPLKQAKNVLGVATASDASPSALPDSSALPT